MLQSAEFEVSIEEQIYKDIKPFVYMGRILGLAPIASQKIGNKHILKISKKYIFYSYIFGLILGDRHMECLFTARMKTQRLACMYETANINNNASSALYSLISDFNASSAESLRIKDTKGAYVVSCDIGLMIFIVILGIFISPFKLGKFFRILDSLQHVETRINFHQEQSRKAFLLISSVSLLLFVSVLTYDCIAWYIKTKGRPAALYLWKNIPLYVLYLVSFSQEISYWKITFFVKRGFIALNHSFKGNQQTLLVKTKKVQLSNQKRHLAEKSLRQINDKKFINHITWRTEKRLTADKVENLIHVFRTLFNTINLINEWYEIPLLFILLSCLFQLIGTPYFIITNTKTNVLAFSILEILWLFTHAGRLLIIVEASHHCIKEYNKINFLLCSHLRMNYDKETAHQLAILGQHIKTCKMGFSTYGITELNRSILASITGAVTTYLVVLVQLKTNSIRETIKISTGNSSI